MTRLTPPAAVVDRVDAALAAALADSAAAMDRISPSAAELISPVREFTAKGKRIRALVTWWGFELAGGSAETEPGIAQVAASVELLHAAALIHDDIIDDSDTRRGKPAIHAAFRTAHAECGWLGSDALYGIGAGIIAGDLCLSLSEEVYTAADMQRLADPRAVLHHDDFRREVMVGQFLDIRLQAAPLESEDVIERAREVLTYKSAKYSVEHPLLLGAALGGAHPDLLARLSEFGLPLGRAFQLRDDELGVFGDPQVTGKPTGDDLRQGKKTVLVGTLLARLDARTAQWFTSRLGASDLLPEELERMAQLMRSTGALAALEDEIDAEIDRAQTALARIAAPECAALAAGDRELLQNYILRLTRRSA